MKRSDLRVEWEQRIANFKASGQSATKWCDTNEVSVHQFWYWKKKLKTTEDTFKDSSQWVALEMDDSMEDSHSKIVIHVGHVALEVKHGFDQKLLVDVVRTLQSIC
ncbi:IS66 family insertion sequence element accessory protein TnpA [Bacillus weihaiensis]|uniref:IS66 family insertion sequence element accessory protein TnpA n=1 Tax=Bacillus weihaiensis TaxID=1547283 RepID=UPI0023540D81|nr:IS66 family insertion sequence element accessory protein TnpB [Bacillus weihaiensis]